MAPQKKFCFFPLKSVERPVFYQSLKKFYVRLTPAWPSYDLLTWADPEKEGALIYAGIDRGEKFFPIKSRLRAKMLLPPPWECLMFSMSNMRWKYILQIFLKLDKNYFLSSVIR